jgi:hypothetical protein
MRKLAVAVVVVWIGWKLLHRDRGRDADRAPQAAVLRDGFAVIDRDRVVEVEPDGRERQTIELSTPHDVRLVGMRTNPGAVWLDAGKVIIGAIGADGEIRDQRKFGSKATQLCDGVASNEQRFGVGWLESDGRVWVVHGPVASLAADETPIAIDAVATKPTWCGVASADDQIALLWREGTKVFVNFCSKKKCSGYLWSAPVEPDRLVGFGCLKTGCAFATDDGVVTYARDSGKVTWRRELPGARRGQRVTVVGGNKRFAIGYATAEGAAAVRIAVDGTVAQAWRGAADAAPALVLSGNRLFAAYRRDHDLVHHVATFP